MILVLRRVYDMARMLPVAYEGVPLPSDCLSNVNHTSASVCLSVAAKRFKIVEKDVAPFVASYRYTAMANHRVNL
jgi:hypothetical protein